MYIILCGRQGSGKTTVAEALKAYYSYRGTACFAYDFMQPVQEVHDAAFIALQRYGMPHPPEDLYSRLPYQYIYSWLEMLLPTYANAELTKVIQRWDDLKMYHIAVVHGMTKPAQLEKYLTGFKVLLTCNVDERNRRITTAGGSSAFCLRDYNHPIEAGFDDCAVSDIFDLVVDTGMMTPDKVASHIGECLHKKLFGDKAP